MTSFSNAEAALESGETVGFSFGENWKKYLADLTPERKAMAKRSLEEAFPAGIEGKRFIDIGSGSGLFSLSALELGAAHVTSIDVDPNSCACAVRLRGEDTERWSIECGSVLDLDFLARIQAAECVYSWGVLHHSGAMWRAISNAMTLVAPGGAFLVALYNTPNRLGLHMALKRTYNRLPRAARPAMAVAYAAVWIAYRSLADRISPVRFVREYGARTRRGMSFYRDVEDWLGGLPFEVAEPDDIRAFLEDKDFTLEHVMVDRPGNNNEYLLRRAG
jgi:2-polyprenyl-6-hydroxyphenyl methylase/3-demethylubiquinone-9 3-methyltransferase